MSNGTITVNECSGNGKMTASLTEHQSTATSVHSSVTGTPQHIREWLMSSQAASHVSRSALPEINLEQMTPVICGPQLSQPLARYDPDTHSWRTCQGWLLADISAPSWETWPKAGMVLDGAFCPQSRWEHRTREIGSGSSRWTTPTATDYKRRGRITKNMSGSSLPQQLNTPERWPTPTTQQNNQVKGNAAHPKRGTTLAGAIGGAAEPDVRRVAHGVANRVDRLKALGNGQVSLVAATAWHLLTGEI